MKRHSTRYADLVTDIDHELSKGRPYRQEVDTVHRIYTIWQRTRRERAWRRGIRLCMRLPCDLRQKVKLHIHREMRFPEQVHLLASWYLDFHTQLARVMHQPRSLVPYVGSAEWMCRLLVSLHPDCCVQERIRALNVLPLFHVAHVLRGGLGRRWDVTQLCPNLYRLRAG
tara:strand:+ start:1255 stop:1764 length:510 start_codon:yes stop_codon:yes gene_type:complete